MYNNSENKNKSYKIYLIAFFVILTLPLLAASPWFHPAAWGKTIVFRIIISGLLFFFFCQIISRKIKINFRDLLDKKNEIFWPFWLLIALWSVFLLATIFSLDPYYSFWESPYRAGGFLNFSLYIIFAILAFLIIKERDWPKIWYFCLIIGGIASIIAILQYFQVFSKHLIPYADRPPATFGNSIFLAIYLLLLLFLALSFGLNPVRDSKNKEGAQNKQISNGVKEKRRLKKIFYFSIILLFISVILLVESRAVYLGLSTGFLYFFLFYSSKRPSKKILYLKIITGIVLVLVASGIYFINTREQLPDFIQNNSRLQKIASRLSFGLLLEESRFSTWKISIEAIKEKPIFGYGPENFSIAFDKYYDPNLPALFRIWWDRAHNFMLDIAVTTGIPALIIYLSLFVVLFWHLQKHKRKNPDDSLICQGIQASFIGYLTANFFSFDSFSTYLIFFLLVAYSLSLINSKKILSLEENGQIEKEKELKPAKPIFFSLLFLTFLWFVYSLNLKPFSINKEINLADYWANAGQCDEALEIMDTRVLSSQSIIDSYARLKYIEIVEKCTKDNLNLKLTLAPKVISALKEAAKIRPYYTRNWLFLGNYTNLLIENKDYLKIKNIEELKKESDSFFEKAYQLNPKREELFYGWIQTDLLSKNYQSAKEKAEECVKVNPKLAYCWWLKALSNIYLKDLEQADKDITIAIEKGLTIERAKPLFQLRNAYMTVLEVSEDKEFQMRCYEKLAFVYKNLTLYVDPKNIQYYDTLANIYKILGEYRKAREQAIFIVRYSKESQDKVKEFLDLLFSLDNNYFEHHFSLAFFYKELNELEKSWKEALIVKGIAPPINTIKEEKVIRFFGIDIYGFIKEFPNLYY